MTTATLTSRTTTGRPPLITRPLLLRFGSVIGSSVSFYLPLSVVPLYAKSSGAGLATGALLLATVAAELGTPRLIARIGYRLSLTIGLALLGAPALALLASANLAIVVGVSVIRGVGFAITTVAGGALTAALIPAERRGEGLGLVGIVGGVPALLALPAGVWVSARWGYSPVFGATAAAALLALCSVPGIPGRRDAGGSDAGRRDAERRDAGSSNAGRGRNGVLAALRSPDLTRLAIVFATTTMAAGVVVTFLPLAVSAGSAAIALFAQQAVATCARWAAGRIGDSYGQARLLCPGVVLSAAGMTCLSATHSTALIVAGAACFGTGFGILQNATLTMMYARGPRGNYSAVSAVWNAAYDAGMGAGAIGIGLVVAQAGYPVAFLLTAALVLPALAPAFTEQGRSGRGRRNRAEAATQC